MKKILSVALSTAMAFSMFASVAFGADAKLTDEQQFNALKEAGIFTGYPDGQSHLEKALTRAELAKIIVKSIGLEPVNGVASYKDKNYTVNHWAAPFIESATQAGILNGKDPVKKLFDPTGNVTVQELAKVLVTALKLEVPTDANNTASDWAKGYVAAAVKAGYISEGVNYQANATRSQAVVAAYAIYEANQVPTVKSYKVVDPKNVEFTMSDNEVVKVPLEKALEANKETEVKFTYKDKEYTHKVTYVTTVAQKVESVKSEALKQIVVTFDGSVDAETAGDEDNYIIKDRSFHSATVSSDKKSVTLLVDEKSSSLVNQKEIELEIKNIKNEDGTKTFSQKVKFTPLDVAAPTVKEVTGLGTKAFKIKFSEPVNPGAAMTSSSYKIDGKAIGASIKFSYPDTVIVQTALTTGEHTVSVENVKDFAGLGVAAVSNTFTVTEDTVAPEVVSATTKDLKEVIVEFNETIKAVAEASANTSSNKASRVVIEDNKVRLFFNNPINYSENTITLKGVTDYSDNKADREVKVTPKLDTVRPTVSDLELKLNSDGHYVAKVRFSEDLDDASAKDKANYVVKKSDGTVATVAGLNSKGNPTITPGFDGNNKRVILVDLGSELKTEKYTLTISGIKDTASIGNVMLPVTLDLDVSKAAKGEIDRVWYGDAEPGYKYVYVEFNKDVATSGEGSATVAAKYYLLNGTTSVGQLTDENNDVDILTSKSVRIKTKLLNNINQTDIKNYSIQASYIANSEGEFLKQNGRYELTKSFSDSQYIGIKTDSVKAISTTEIKVEFDSKINNLSETDFLIGNQTAYSYTLASDGKSVTLKLNDTDSTRLPSDLKNADGTPIKLSTVAQSNIYTQNEHGVKLEENKNLTIVDEIKPELKDDSLRLVNVTATTATYDISFDVTENVKFNTSVYNVGLTDQVDLVNRNLEIEAVSNNVTYKGKVTTANFGTGKTVTFRVEFTKDGQTVPNLGANASFYLKVKGDNETNKYIVDGAGNGLKGDSLSRYYKN
ncbi:S-layer family protein [Fontibacillus phaseoli]|uniref:S-layer family protein n=2 Tax=Fontibacillus phaseoli TaxID=1416533 RepID=A0A369BC48_9BACL|nr:S-layer family protein [Fontibacillus phaseoli]